MVSFIHITFCASGDMYLKVSCCLMNIYTHTHIHTHTHTHTGYIYVYIQLTEVCVCLYVYVHLGSLFTKVQLDT
jgi:hypothetical protein